MKCTWLILAMLAIMISAVAWTRPGDAEPLAIRNCTWCHGAQAEGYAPAPRLAGQKPAYIENQLMSFRAHTRDAPFSKLYMWGAAANLSRQRMRDLAAYFSALHPQAADDGDKKLAAMGQSIYQLGLPDSNIVACVACHGPHGEGIGQIPRLGGLSYSYLKRRLEQWQEGYQSAIPRPMPHIASNLSGQQIAALASYLSFLEYPDAMRDETASAQRQ